MYGLSRLSPVTGAVFSYDNPTSFDIMYSIFMKI